MLFNLSEPQFPQLSKQIFTIYTLKGLLGTLPPDVKSDCIHHPSISQDEPITTHMGKIYPHINHTEDSIPTKPLKNLGFPDCFKAEPYKLIHTYLTVK